MNLSDRYMTIAETAEFLRIGRTKLYKIRDARILVYEKIGGRLKIRKSEIEKAIDRGRLA